MTLLPRRQNCLNDHVWQRDVSSDALLILNRDLSARSKPSIISCGSCLKFPLLFPSSPMIILSLWNFCCHKDPWPLALHVLESAEECSQTTFPEHVFHPLSGQRWNFISRFLMRWCRRGANNSVSDSSGSSEFGEYGANNGETEQTNRSCSLMHH